MRYESAVEWQHNFKRDMLVDMVNVDEQPLECADAANRGDLFDTFGLEVYYKGTRDLVSVLLFMKGRAYVRTVRYRSIEPYDVRSPPGPEVVNPYRTGSTPRDCILPEESGGRRGFDVLDSSTAYYYAVNMAVASVNPDPVNNTVDPSVFNDPTVEKFGYTEGTWRHAELSQLQQMRVRHLVLHFDKKPVLDAEGRITEPSMQEPVRQFAQCLFDRGRTQARLILKAANAFLKKAYDERRVTLPRGVTSVYELYHNPMDVEHFPLIRKGKRNKMVRGREDWHMLYDLL